MVTLQGLYAGWMVLNELMGDLSRRGVFIPDLTYADLRNSKMVLEYLREFDRDIHELNGADARLRDEMETKIISLRDTMLVWAEDAGGRAYRRDWEQRFDDAVHERTEIPHGEPSRTPISDLPREKGTGFFRIRLPEEIPVEVVGELAEECRVLITLDGDRHLQVSGKKEHVRVAMRRLGELFYGSETQRGSRPHQGAEDEPQ